MPRSNKRSRIKGLPPKLYLQTRDAHTGSYPSKVRTTVNGLSGGYKIFWDDTNTINFESTNANVTLGTQLETSYMDKPAFKEIYGNDFSCSLASTIGSITKGVSDIHLGFTPGESFKPYVDFSNAEVDAKSQNNSFFATGSDLEGFSGPLWSKTKIEIDISALGPSQGRWTDDTGIKQNYPMLYWNNEKRVWEGLGDGSEYWGDIIGPGGNNITTIEEMVEKATIGFNGTYESFYVATQYAGPQLEINLPMSNYGFPSHQKFHATSSNAIRMSDYIKQPFLLEKMVLEIKFVTDAWQGAFWGGEVGWTKTFQEFNPDYRYETHTFFILNQRKRQKAKYVTSLNAIDGGPFSGFVGSSTYTLQNLVTARKIPDSNYLEYGTDKIIETTRDIVTWASMLSIKKDLADTYLQTLVSNFGSEAATYKTPFTEVELRNLHDRSIYALPGVNDKFRFDGHYVISASVKSPQNYTSNIPVILWAQDMDMAWPDDPFVGTGTPDPQALGFYTSFEHPGRNGTNMVSNRSHRNELQKAELLKRSNKFQAGPYGTKTSQLPYEILKERQTVNPYLLQPEDELILGWQVPVGNRLSACPFDPYPQTQPVAPQAFFRGIGPTVDIPAGPAKITLYGSYIKEGKEFHDTTNQHLTSDAIHEVIGDD